MKLLNDFFTIKSSKTNDGDLVYNIYLNKDHYIYKSHFPDNPITPGVCILQIAQELLENHLNINMQLQKVQNIKYMSIISPISVPEISLSISYSQSDVIVKAKGVIKNSNNIFTKFSTIYHKL